VEKPTVLRASTPGGHPLINLAWVWSALLVLGSFIGGPPAIWGVLVALAALAVYLYRHRKFLERLDRADRALDRGELTDARALIAPLLERYPALPIVQKAAAAALYASGDPLSAASLYERAAKHLRRDPDVAIGLVASYAALNKAGDARRAAELDPTARDVRLALAWAELVALGGDREHGVALTRALFAELDATAGAERIAMTNALVAIAAARRGDRVGASAAIDRTAKAIEPLAAADAAFVGYLQGVALREAGAPKEARAVFDRAMERAPGSIGEALARRERSRLDGGAQVPTGPEAQSSESSSSGQPASD